MWKTKSGVGLVSFGPRSSRLPIHIKAKKICVEMVQFSKDVKPKRLQFLNQVHLKCRVGQAQLSKILKVPNSLKTQTSETREPENLDLKSN